MEKNNNIIPPAPKVEDILTGTQAHSTEPTLAARPVVVKKETKIIQETKIPDSSPLERLQTNVNKTKDLVTSYDPALGDVNLAEAILEEGMKEFVPHIVEMLKTARESANQLKLQSKQEAEQTIHAAEIASSAIISKARADADAIVQAKVDEAARLTDEIYEMAEEMIASSKHPQKTAKLLQTFVNALAKRAQELADEE